MLPVAPSRRFSDILFTGFLALLVLFALYLSTYRPSLERRRAEWLAISTDSLDTINKGLIAGLDTSQTKGQTTASGTTQNAANKGIAPHIPFDWQPYMPPLPPPLNQWAITFIDTSDDVHTPALIATAGDTTESTPTHTTTHTEPEEIEPEDEIPAILETPTGQEENRNRWTTTGISVAAFIIIFVLLYAVWTRTGEGASKGLIAGGGAFITAAFISLALSVNTSESSGFLSAEAIASLFAFFNYLIIYTLCSFVVYMLLQAWRKDRTKQPKTKPPIRFADLSLQAQREELLMRLTVPAFSVALSGIVLYPFLMGLPFVIMAAALYSIVFWIGWQQQFERILYHAAAQSMIALASWLVSYWAGIAQPDSWMGWSNGVFTFSLIIAVVGIILFSAFANKKPVKSKKQQPTPKDTQEKKETPEKPQPVTDTDTPKWAQGLDIPAITQLDLSHQQLKDDSNDDLNYLMEGENIRELNLRYNQFTEIPFELEFLEKLETLALGHNKITSAETVDWACLSALKELDLSYNKLQTLPEDLLTLPSLRILTLTGNPIGAKRIRQYTKLNPNLTIRFATQEKAKQPGKPPAQKGKKQSADPRPPKQMDSEEQKAWEVLQSKLKKELQKPKEVTHINLISAGLTCLPKGFLKQFPQLQDLSLAHNPLKAFPMAVLESKNTLSALHLTGTEITELPEVLLTFPRLEELSIGGIRWESFPALLADMPHLRSLMLNDCPVPFAQVAPVLRQLTTLERLSLAGTNFQNPDDQRLLDECLRAMPHLQRLNISFCQLSEVPAALFECPQLKVLQLSGNQFESLPTGDQWARLPHLQEIYLSYNKETILNEAVVESWATLSALHALDLGGMGLSDVPSALQSLQSLTYLAIHANKLTFLPAPVLALQQLQVLNVSKNQLQFLPEKIHHLQQLRHVYLEDNPLQNLPKGLQEMPKLVSISLPKSWSQAQRKATVAALPDTIRLQWL